MEFRSTRSDGQLLYIEQEASRGKVSLVVDVVVVVVVVIVVVVVVVVTHECACLSIFCVNVYVSAKSLCVVVCIRVSLLLSRSCSETRLAFNAK